MAEYGKKVGFGCGIGKAKLGSFAKEEVGVGCDRRIHMNGVENLREVR